MLSQCAYSHFSFIIKEHSVQFKKHLLNAYYILGVRIMKMDVIRECLIEKMNLSKPLEERKKLSNFGQEECARCIYGPLDLCSWNRMREGGRQEWKQIM